MPGEAQCNARMLQQLRDGARVAIAVCGIGVEVPGDLEARLAKELASVATPRKAAEAAKPKTPEPPFRVVGLELRGGERFVSVSAPGASALADLRLLRPGDSAGGWQLQAIEAQAAAGTDQIDRQLVGSFRRQLEQQLARQ